VTLKYNYHSPYKPHRLIEENESFGSSEITAY